MRILVVDDDPGLRQSLGLLLSEAGHEVTAEGEARRALARAPEVDPDVILSDVRMPGMDGLEFLRAYRTSGGRAILLMMSAHGSEESAIAAMRESSASMALTSLTTPRSTERLRPISSASTSTWMNFAALLKISPNM